MTLANILTGESLAGMRTWNQWVVYSLEKLPDNRTRKTPLHFATLKPTGVNDPASWTDCATACTVAAGAGPGYGVGFCFTEADPYWFIDLDGAALPDGTGWSPLATQVCQAFAGAALEVSSSGRGLHLFGRGVIPPHASKNIEQHAELYHTDRFVALTGTHLSGNCDTDHSAALAWLVPTYFPPRVAAPVHANGPDPAWRGPTDDADLIRRALQSRSAGSVFGSRASFADLWTADARVLAVAYPADRSSSDSFDRSSADAALAQHLAFWTGRDAARMETLMRQSALRREKYDRSDYLERTITNACSLQREVLQDKPPQASPLANLGTGGVSGDPPPSAAAAGAPPSAAAPAGQTPVTGNTFLAPAEQQALFAGCVYVADQHRILVPGGELRKPDQFRALFGGYTFAMDARNERTCRNAFEAFTESQVLRPTIVDGVCFRPDLPFGSVITSEGRRRVNTYWPAQVRRVAGDITPFTDHLRRVFPRQADADTLLYFMAQCLQSPGLKAQWMPLIVGVEGNGKSFFSRCLAYAIGRRYTHWPAANKLGKDFNAWLFGRLLYCIEDLKIGDSADLWEKLKPMITGEEIEIEGKGVDQRSDEICGNFLANSNHIDAVKATANDRRVAHLHCAQMDVTHLARDGIDQRYISGLYDWAKGEGKHAQHGAAYGYAVVAEYLHTLPIPPEFGRSWFLGRAPQLAGTSAAIAHSLGAVEQEIIEAIEQGLPGFAGGWVSSHYLNLLIGRMGRGGAVPPNRRRGMMRALGYEWHPALVGGRVNNAVLPDGVKSILYIRNGHAHAALGTPAEVARAYSAAQSVGAAR
jgi:hypothetical protein